MNRKTNLLKNQEVTIKVIGDESRVELSTRKPTIKVPAAPDKTTNVRPLHRPPGQHPPKPSTVFPQLMEKFLANANTRGLGYSALGVMGSGLLVACDNVANLLLGGDEAAKGIASARMGAGRGKSFGSF